VLEQLIREELTPVEKETLAEVKKLLKLCSPDPNEHERAMEFFSETSTPDEEGRGVHLYNAAFKNCQDFAARIALRLCTEGLLRRHGVRRALELLMTARKLASIAMDSSARRQPTSLRLLRDKRYTHTHAPHGRSHGASGHTDHASGIASSGWFINTVLVPPAR
jgi:hypothetical protein